ncbi:MAG TPA: MFS transporter, partial [Armatimonadota bacterium]|nr:MFS transporter [Armatimonadota bacterium]
FALAPAYPLLVAARALVGLGSSLIFISLVKALATLFSPRYFAPLLSLVMFTGALGGVVGTLPIKWLAGLWGWRAALLWAGLLCALAFLGAALIARRAAAPTPQAPPLWPSLRAVLRNRAAWPLMLAAPLTFTIYFLLQTVIGVKFLRDVAGLTGALASTITFVMMVVNLSIVLSGGFLVEMFGRRRKPFILLGVGFLLLSLLLLLAGLWLRLGGGWFLVCYICLALSSFVSPVSNVLMREMNPAGAIGTAIGALNGLCYLGVALLASAAGTVMTAFRAGAVQTATAIVYPREAYFAIFLLCGALALVALISALYLRDTRGVAVAEA